MSCVNGKSQMPPRRLVHKAALWAIMAGIPNAKIAEGFNARGARMHLKVIGVLCVGALCALRVKKSPDRCVAYVLCFLHGAVTEAA